MIEGPEILLAFDSVRERDADSNARPTSTLTPLDKDGAHEPIKGLHYSQLSYALYSS